MEVNICHLSPLAAYCAITAIAVKKSRYKKGSLFL